MMQRRDLEKNGNNKVLSMGKRGLQSLLDVPDIRLSRAAPLFYLVLLYNDFIYVG